MQLSEKYLGEILNPKQLEAVLKIDGPVAVYAGAGSGKTRVITYRIAWMLSKGIPLTSIMALTFTNKASQEMKEPIQALLGFDIRYSWIGTFHSICLRLLRQSGEDIGISSRFSVFDDEDSLALIKECMKQLNLDIKRFNPKAIQHTISEAKINLIMPDQYLQLAGTSYYTEIVSNVYQSYEKGLLRNQAMDFDDLITKSVLLFQQYPKVLDKWHHYFSHILVDEYQDINQAQYLFLKMMSSKNSNICIVGDDDQSIYSFRGADPRMMISFTKDFPSATVIKLEENYRCSQNILHAANGVVSKNTARTAKELWTKNEPGSKIQLLNAQNERDEALKIIQIIKEKAEKDQRPYSDFVLLYRINAQSRHFEEALINERIPYQMVGGYKFYQRKEIKDFLAYLKVLVNPQDRVSFHRIVNYPKRNIGTVFLSKIDQLSDDEQCSFKDACRKIALEGTATRGKKGLTDFIDLIDENIALLGQAPIAEVAENYLAKSGIYEALAEEYPEEIAREKKENLQELISSIRQYEREEENPNLADFLNDIALYSDLDKFEDIKEKITLMTLHSAKGLEFPIVFMVGFEEGIFPHYLSNNNTDALEEERRLCYVGITRAKEELYISCAKMREIYGKATRTLPSRFLEDIPEELLKHMPMSLNGRSSEPTKELNSFQSYSARLPSYRPSNKIVPTEPDDFGGLSFDELSPGDSIEHKAWGLGKILKKDLVQEESVVVIHFSTVGEKMVNLKYAPIKKVLPTISE
jgi:DNA helicase II / ATP-dependent DNA helicase PcrA